MRFGSDSAFAFAFGWDACLFIQDPSSSIGFSFGEVPILLARQDEWIACKETGPQLVLKAFPHEVIYSGGHLVGECPCVDRGRKC